MTASALSGVRPPQAHIGLPILWPEDIQGEDDGGTTGILGALGYSWKEMGAPRAEVAASIVGGKYLQVVGAPRRLGDRHLSVRMQGPVAAGRRDDDRAV